MIVLALEPGRAPAKYLSANLGYATIRDPQIARSAERKIENAAANPRSAIGDTNYDRHAALNISDANSRAERQAAVGCGQ